LIRGGSAPYTCSATGLPAGITVGPNAVAVPSGPLAGRQACQISGTAPGAGSSPVDLTVTDNSAPPLMSSAGYTLTIRPEFAFNAITTPPIGVVGRTYGAPAETSPLETTTVSATVGNSPLVTCALSGTGGNASLTASVSGTANCALSSGGTNLASMETDNLMFSATDTPITDPFTQILAVPANTISAASTAALAVQSALMITSGAFNPPAWTQNATNAYPTQMVTVSGGVQASLACMLTGYTSGLMVTPSPGVCALNGDPTVANAPAGAMITITVSDGGNTAVPPPTVMPSVSGTIVVNAQAALSTLETAFADGVENRLYSVAASASGGTGTLTLSSTGLNAANCTGLTLSSVASASPVSGTVMGTPTVALVGNATATCMFSLTVTDITNTATTTNYTATIHAPLVLSFTPNPGFGTGVSGQPFTQTLTATGGLQPVTACMATGVPASLTTSFTASTCTLMGTPLVGDQGTTTAMITVTDTVDSATAAGMSTASSSLTINPPLAITPPARIINALSGFSYPSAFTLPASVTYNVTAGTGTGGGATLTAAANAAGAVCGAQGSAGTFPMGLTFTNQTGTSAELTGTPTSATSTLYSFPICAVDAGSSSTAAYAVNTPANVSLAVLSPSAFAAAPGTNTVEVFSTALAATPNSPVASIAVSGTPQAVAVTPDGRYAIVTEQTPDQIDVIDTTTNTALANSPFSLSTTNCGTPVGVAADSTNVYVACDSTAGTNVEEVLVLNEGMLTTGGGGGGAFSVTTQIVTGVGSAPDSIAFNTADTRADVTLSGTNQLMIIDNTVAPPAPIAVTQGGNPQGVFNLPATTATPREIAVLQNTASGSPLDYAYIAKQSGTSSTINFVSASKAECDTSAAAASKLTCPVGASTTTGNTVVVMVAINPATTTVSGVTDSGGSTYSLIPTCAQNSTGVNVRIECWATPAAGAKATGASVSIPIAAAPNGAVENAAGNTATITTTSAHGLSVGQTVVISGINPHVNFNGTFTVASVVSTTVFTVTNTVEGANNTSGGGTVNGSNVTVTLSGSTNFVMNVVEFSGVQSFGNVHTATFGGTNPTISVTTQLAGNFCLAGFAERAPRTFVSNVTGTLLDSGTTGTANGDVGGAVVDNNTAPGMCTTGVQDNGGGAGMNWALAAVELSSGIPAGVDVLDVTNNPTPAGPPVVVRFSEPSGSTPFGVAGVPLAMPGAASGRAYITLQGTNQFDVLDNTVTTPVQVAGAPFNLPDPSMGAAAPVMPVAVAIPPFLAAPFQAYITFSATGQVGILDDGTPPVVDAASPVSLTGGATTAPARVTAIPVPQ
jgi:hypothetical protein